MRKSRIWEILISVFFAICLWIYVVTTVTPEDNLTLQNVPVNFVGESDLKSSYSLIIANRSVSSVTLKFHGKRSDLKRLQSDQSAIYVKVDVSKCTEERDYSSDYEIVLPSALQDADIQITGRSPRTIQFTAEKLQSKTVPLKGVFDGTVKDGFVPGEVTFEQDDVLITGPKQLVEQVSYAQVVIGGRDLSSTVRDRMSFNLIDKNGEPVHSEDITVSTKDVLTTFTVLMEKDVPLGLDVRPGGGATEDNTEITIEPQSVRICGEPGMLESMDELELGILFLSQIPEDTVLDYEITLPDGVKLLSEEDTAVASVSFRNLVSAPSVLTDVALTSVQEGLSAAVTEKEIPIILRGEENAMLSVESVTPHASADLSEYTVPGSYTVPVEIATDNEKIGAVGLYTVTVELTAKET